MKRFLLALTLCLLAPLAHAGCTLGALPFTLSNGTLADANQVMSNFNQIVNQGAVNCAQAGSNNDITSLNALLTPVTPAQGGSNVFVGSAATAGSVNAQQLTVTGPFTLSPGVSVVGVVGGGLTNTGPMTLQINAGASTNVVRNTQFGVQNTAGGEFTAGNQIAATYNGSAWVIQGRFDIIGEMRIYAAGTVPPGWIIADGSTMSCSGSTLPLCNVIGTQYGGTGVLPDTRGRNVTGMDNYGTAIGAAGRLTNAGTGCGSNFTFLGAVCSNSSQSHQQQVSELAVHSHGNSLNDPGHTHGLPGAVGAALISYQLAAGAGNVGGNTASSTTGITINNANQGSSTPMPIVNPNFALFYIMKL